MLACGCGTPSPRPQPVTDSSPRIVVAERSQSGSHLVFIGENGARLADLTRAGAVPVRDDSPAWSPDGQRLVFASTRGRDVYHSSLWLIDARPGARMHRLTSGKWIDRDPAWTGDSKAIVFSSNRAGSFDLWRAEINLAPERPPMLGKPVRLTSADSHELHPSVGPDGRVVYMVGDEAGSSIWVVDSAGGEPLRISAGPADTTPSWSPNGELIAFCAGVEKIIEGQRERADYIDVDLYLMNADGSDRRLVVDEPQSHQNGPRWSHDGRYLFVTSTHRLLSSGESALGSITFVDLREQPPLLRVLHDPAAVETRVTPTLAPATLLSTELHRNRSYAQALLDLGQDLRRRGLLRDSKPSAD